MYIKLTWVILVVATVALCFGSAIRAYAEKHCPVCGRTYPDNYIRCPIDGALLVKVKPARVKAVAVEPSEPHRHRHQPAVVATIKVEPRKPATPPVIPVAKPAPVLPTGIQFTGMTDVSGRHLLTADLWVDGTLKQTLQGACFVPLTAGSHRIEVKKSGYIDFTTSVAIAAGSSLTLQPIFSPATGNLQISTTGVAGDKVSVTDQTGAALADGRASGFTLTDLPIGLYTVSVEADGYEPFKKVVEVTAGGTASIQPALRSQFGSLLVTVPEIAVTVNVDGADVGTSGSPIRLASGTHDLKLTADSARLALDGQQVQGGKQATISLGLFDLTALRYTYDVWVGPDAGSLTDDGKVTRIPAAPGTWVVRLCRPGFPPFDATYDVFPNAVVSVSREPATSTLALSYEPEDDYNTKTCTWYIDHAAVLAGAKGTVEIPPGPHKIGFKATGDGYNWKRTNMFGVVLGTQRIGELISAEFDSNVTANVTTKIDAQSWTDYTGVSGTVFTRPKATIEVDVNGTAVPTLPW
ncbi:MAG: PEGA domain-containing protein [Capsulimonadaceae bacterium]